MGFVVLWTEQKNGSTYVECKCCARTQIGWERVIEAASSPGRFDEVTILWPQQRSSYTTRKLPKVIGTVELKEIAKRLDEKWGERGRWIDRERDRKTALKRARSHLFRKLRLFFSLFAVYSSFSHWISLQFWFSLSYLLLYSLKPFDDDSCVFFLLGFWVCSAETYTP